MINVTKEPSDTHIKHSKRNLGRYHWEIQCQKDARHG
jgi:hypothetical protein